MKKRILSIDGGGVLGIGPLALLSEMEFAGMGTFHAVAGTSTGAILAALYLVKRNWGEALRIFANGYRDIFTQPWNYKIDPLPRTLQFHPKYDGKALYSLLAKHLGDHKCEDFPLVPFFIPAFNWRTGKVKVWNNHDTDLLRDVVAASAAAPSYFPPQALPKPGLWADGGLAANSPSMVALCGCLAEHGWELPDTFMLSLGTGGDFWKDPKVTSGTTLAGLAEPVINSQFAGTEEMFNYMARAFLGDRLCRIDPALSKAYALDDIQHAGEYADLWRGLWKTQRAALSDWWARGTEAPQ